MSLWSQIAVPQTQAPAMPQPGALGPSDKQISYFKSLVEKKQLSEEQRTKLLMSIGTFTKRGMIDMISWLVGLPWAPRPANVKLTPVWIGAKIEQGYYAVNHPTDGTLRFYQVRKPAEGKWLGHIFLSEVSGENHLPMRDYQERSAIFTEIAKDPIGALKRFGKQIGRCGHCKKQLTDEVSREFGIGPVCRKELGI